jgi:hypothetical protein
MRDKIREKRENSEKRDKSAVKRETEKEKDRRKIFT